MVNGHFHPPALLTYCYTTRSTVNQTTSNKCSNVCEWYAWMPGIFSNLKEPLSCSSSLHAKSFVEKVFSSIWRYCVAMMSCCSNGCRSSFFCVLKRKKKACLLQICMYAPTSARRNRMNLHRCVLMH